MEISTLGRRWVLASFDDGNSPFAVPTAVAGIRGRDHVWIVDTHTGPDSMKPLRDWVDGLDPGRRLWVVNSHEDWDHVWGNCAFPDAEIVAEAACAAFLREDYMWVHGLEAWGDAAAGKVLKRPPDLGFHDRLDWPDEGVHLLHRPGHTRGSIHVWDSREGIVFVGDNLEAPLPYLQSHELASYVESLLALRKLGAEVILSSHSGAVDSGLVDRTLRYLESLIEGKPCVPEGEAALAIHRQNLLSMEISRFEGPMREAWGPAFSMEGYVKAVERIGAGGAQELTAGLERLRRQGPPPKESRG